MEAGFPDGVLNVHGTNDIVDYICDDADVKAISFIGSDPVSYFKVKLYTDNSYICDIQSLNTIDLCVQMCFQSDCRLIFPFILTRYCSAIFIIT